MYLHYPSEIRDNVFRWTFLKNGVSATISLLLTLHLSSPSYYHLIVGPTGIQASFSVLPSHSLDTFKTYSNFVLGTGCLDIILFKINIIVAKCYFSFLNERFIPKSCVNFLFSINLDYLEKWYTWKIWDWIHLTLEGLRKQTHSAKVIMF